MELFGSRYEVVRTVSEGRRATVLRALDRQHEKFVALKVYPVTSDTDREELLAEARVLLSITPHPALPVVRGDFFTDDGDRYVVVMDWVDGVDLEEVLDTEGDPGLPLSQVLDDVGLAAAALDHLHGQVPPVVHADVKPANLVRTAEGRIVLVDFDIASTQGEHGRVGTPGYAAPEVAAGEKPTPASDVYGLTATIVTLLNGRPPTSDRPTFPDIDPAEVGAIASVLRAGLAANPADRPPSATRLVERLRAARAIDLPKGVVTLLGIEVANAERLWDEHADEMRTAMTRLNDLVARVVEHRGGRIVNASIDGTIAVFREASAAADAALGLQDRLDDATSMVGLGLRVRIGLEVGEADLVDGAYFGAVLDRVGWLRSIAAPGATITTQSSAELLRDLLDDNVAIVPLDTIHTANRTRATAVCALTRSGREHTGRLDAGVMREPIVEPTAPVGQPVSRRHVVVDALQHPATLTAVTVAGCALIYLRVLAPELGSATVALTLLVLSAAAAIVCFARQYSIGYGVEEARRELERLEREEAEAARQRTADMVQRRRELERGFSRIGSDGGSRVLDGLTHEFDALQESLRRERDGSLMSFAHILPSLATDTYLTGLSVLNQALGLLEVSQGARRRRLEQELSDITARLDDPANTDDRERARDESRKRSHEETLAALDHAHNGARDALLEAERCEDALHRARVELASVDAGNSQLRAESVIDTLSENIRRVREVQEELRKLRY